MTALPTRRARDISYTALVLAVVLLQHGRSWQQPANAQEQLCDASGYCSLRQQPASRYIGPIEANADLRRAVQTLAYKQEMIVTMDNRPDYTAQFVANVQAAGYAHVLLIAPELLCRRLARVFQQIGCGWYHSNPETHLPLDERLAVMGLQMYLKHWTGVRIARMGYNVMILDGDVLVLSDFYVHIKAPPFDQYQVIVHSDGESENVNCGFVYLQNASPSGPAVWALADAIVRTLRLFYQPAGIEALGLERGFVCWDQHCIHDAFYSAILGRPYFSSCLAHSRRPNWSETWRDLVVAATNATDREKPIPFEVVRASSAAAVILNEPEYRLYHAKLYLPHVYGRRATSLGVSGWPEHLGGRVYGNEAMSSVVKGFIQDYLITDIGAPMWPDLEDPATAAAADASPSEALAFTPLWLVNNYVFSGMFGHWHTRLTNDTKSVLGHIWAGLPPGQLQKRTILFCGGQYDYNVSARLWGGPSRVYTATHHYSPHQQQQPPPLQHPLVLAYVPGFFDHTTSHDEYGSSVADLGKLAVASRRLIGWPGAPLAAGWTHRSGVNLEGYGVGGKPHVVPWDYLEPALVMAYVPINDTLVELSGVWSPMFDAGCMTQHAAVIKNNERNRRLHSSSASQTSSSRDRGDVRIREKVAAATEEGMRDVEDDYVARQPLQLAECDDACHSSGARRLLDRTHAAGGGGRTAHQGRGLMPPELRHFISTLTAGDAAAGPHNTLQVPEGSVAGSDGVVEVAAEHVVQEALRMTGQPIVYVGRRMRVGPLGPDDERRYEALRTSCCAMRYDEFKGLPPANRACPMQF